MAKAHCNNVTDSKLWSIVVVMTDDTKGDELICFTDHRGRGENPCYCVRAHLCRDLLAVLVFQ